MTRLPIPGADDGSWGNILNDFLSVEHNGDGSLKSAGSLGNKADANAVVYLSGNQTITGVKAFSSSPTLPTPINATDATTKAYVDSATSPHATLTPQAAVWLSDPAYGAVGDLTADDSAALSAALSALPASGGTIHITGTHIVGGIGSSRSVCIMLHPGSMLKLKAGGSTLISLTSTNRVEIIGPGVLDGNQANANGSTSNDLVQIIGSAWADVHTTIQNTAGNGLSLTNVSAGRIQGTINECKGHGVRVIDSDRIFFNASVTNTDRCGYIVMPNTRDVFGHITQGVFDTNGRASNASTQYPSVYWNSMGGGPSGNFNVKHSRFEPHITNAGWVGGFPGGQYNIVGAGLYINGSGLAYAPTGHGLFIHSSGDITIEKGVEISGSKRSGICIQNTPKVKGYGGIIYNNDQEGILLEAITGVGPYDSTIANNDVWLEYYVVKNNGQSLAGTYGGVAIKGYANVTLSKNVITDDQATKTQLRGVTCTNNAVQNCTNLDFLYNDCSGNINSTIFSFNGIQYRRLEGNNPATQDTRRTGTVAYTSGTIAAGDISPVMTISSSGSVVGYGVRAALSVALPDGCTVEGQVSATNTIHVWIKNGTATPQTPSSGTITAEFFRLIV